MKQIQKVVQKLSREQESAADGVRTGIKHKSHPRYESQKLLKSYRVNKNLQPPVAAAAYEPVQKHKVNPGIPGWLNYYFIFHYCSQ